MYVTILVSLVVQTEYRNNTWKMVYMQPRSQCRYLLLEIRSDTIITPGFPADLQSRDPGHRIFCQYLSIGLCVFPKITSTGCNAETHGTRMYIASLCITAIQYWFSLKFKNFITSMGLGIGLTIVALSSF